MQKEYFYIIVDINKTCREALECCILLCLVPIYFANVLERNNSSGWNGKGNTLIINLNDNMYDKLRKNE